MILSTAMTKLDSRDAEIPLGYRPLYRQVRALLVRRLAEGVWQPGQLLPSEGQLAAELGVSQGTVRKALDALTAERLLVRRQGRGTFVAEHDGERILFHFFKLMPDAGKPSFPESRIVTTRAAQADADERDRLGPRRAGDRGGYRAARGAVPGPRRDRASEQSLRPLRGALRPHDRPRAGAAEGGFARCRARDAARRPGRDAGAPHRPHGAGPRRQARGMAPVALPDRAAALPVGPALSPIPPPPSAAFRRA